MGRGAVHRREVNSHTYVFFQVGPTCSGRMATVPVLMADTAEMGSLAIDDMTSDYTASSVQPMRDV